MDPKNISKVKCFYCILFQHLLFCTLSERLSCITATTRDNSVSFMSKRFPNELGYFSVVYIV